MPIQFVHERNTITKKCTNEDLHIKSRLFLQMYLKNKTLKPKAKKVKTCMFSHAKVGCGKTHIYLTSGQEVGAGGISWLPAVAAVEFLGGEAVGTAVGPERSSRGAQLSPDAFEPIPLEEVQDHFRPETGESWQPRAVPTRERSLPRPLPA